MLAAVVRDRLVVLQRGGIAGALDVAAHEVASLGFVKRALRARQHARVRHQVVDDRLGVRPVRARTRHERPELVGRRRQLAL